MIDATARIEAQELRNREKTFRGGRQPAEVCGHKIILVDEGLATGASMRAAVRALHQQNPISITVAVPIASRDTCDQIRNEVDELICGDTPESFFAVGTRYSNFTQTMDDEVSHLLDRAAHERRLRRVQEHRERALVS